MNIVRQGAGSLVVLEDFVMYDNTVVQGASQAFYTRYVKLTKEQQNSKSALESAINAIGFNLGLFGEDYSHGANAWDGKDLVDSRMSNSHRKYRWTLNSKVQLRKYSQMYGNGVDVTSFNYTEDDPQATAIKVVGETLLIKILTPLGGRKQNEERFK
ncbi:MAG: hypothetical protein ACOCWM_04140 [Cyclobacteriaceae bacterium]